MNTNSTSVRWQVLVYSALLFLCIATIISLFALLVILFPTVFVIVSMVTCLVIFPALSGISSIRFHFNSFITSAINHFQPGKNPAPVLIPFDQQQQQNIFNNKTNLLSQTYVK